MLQLEEARMTNAEVTLPHFTCCSAGTKVLALLVLKTDAETTAEANERYERVMMLYVASRKEVKRLANVETLLKTALEDISEVRLY